MAAEGIPPRLFLSPRPFPLPLFLTGFPQPPDYNGRGQEGRGVTVYIDRVFVLNLLVDYLLLLAAARLAGAPLRRGRFALCACLGGGYAVAVLLPGLAALGAVWCRAAVGLGMALLAYWRERSRLRLAALFFLLSGALAGLILAAGLALGTARQIPQRLWQARIDWKLLLGGTALLSAVLDTLAELL